MLVHVPVCARCRGQRGKLRQKVAELTSSDTMSALVRRMTSCSCCSLSWPSLACFPVGALGASGGMSVPCLRCPMCVTPANVGVQQRQSEQQQQGRGVTSTEPRRNQRGANNRRAHRNAYAAPCARLFDSIAAAVMLAIDAVKSGLRLAFGDGGGSAAADAAAMSCAAVAGPG